MPKEMFVDVNPIEYGIAYVNIIDFKVSHYGYSSECAAFNRALYCRNTGTYGYTVDNAYMRSDGKHFARLYIFFLDTSDELVITLSTDKIITRTYVWPSDLRFTVVNTIL